MGEKSDKKMLQLTSLSPQSDSRKPPTPTILAALTQIKKPRTHIMAGIPCTFTTLGIQMTHWVTVAMQMQDSTGFYHLFLLTTVGTTSPTVPQTWWFKGLGNFCSPKNSLMVQVDEKDLVCSIDGVLWH